MAYPKIKETELWEYISKNADISTIQKIEKWMDSPDFNEALFIELTNIYTRTAEQDVAVEQAKKQFFKTVKSKTVVWKNLLKYAAILVIVITGTYAYNWVSSNKNRTVVQTSFGEQMNFTLTDGSKVWLNASSSISYNPESPRTLRLEGEAFFEVAKDTLHPFTVTTLSNITVKALGTSFNIKSYKESPITETKLLTGKVMVSSDTQFAKNVMLLPNEKLSFYKKTKEVLKSKMDVSSSKIAWKEGKIEFENTSFQEIAIDLKAHFGQQIRFKNEHTAITKFTGSFDTSTPIGEIFEILKMSKDFTYELNTKTNEWMIN